MTIDDRLKILIGDDEKEKVYSSISRVADRIDLTYVTFADELIKEAMKRSYDIIITDLTYNFTHQEQREQAIDYSKSRGNRVEELDDQYDEDDSERLWHLANQSGIIVLEVLKEIKTKKILWTGYDNDKILTMRLKALDATYLHKSMHLSNYLEGYLNSLKAK